MPVFQSQIATADESVGADLLVVPLRSTEGLYALLAGLGPGIATAAARAVDLGDFRGEGDRLLVHARGPERYPRALLVGIGPEDSPPGRVRNAFTAALRDPMFSRMDTVAVLCGPALGSGSTLTSAVAEAVDGISQGVYLLQRGSDCSRYRPSRLPQAQGGRVMGDKSDLDRAIEVVENRIQAHNKLSNSLLLEGRLRRMHEEKYVINTLRDCVKALRALKDKQP
jgi:hypothetical protein